MFLKSLSVFISFAQKLTNRPFIAREGGVSMRATNDPKLMLAKHLMASNSLHASRTGEFTYRVNVQAVFIPELCVGDERRIRNGIPFAILHFWDVTE